MKRKLLNHVSLALALICATSACSMLQSKQTTAGKTIASIAIVADGVMKGWASWVALGKATPQDQAEVNANYALYQTAMAAARDAYVVFAQTGDSTEFDKRLTALTLRKDNLVTTTKFKQSIKEVK